MIPSRPMSLRPKRHLLSRSRNIRKYLSSIFQLLLGPTIDDLFSRKPSQKTMYMASTPFTPGRPEEKEEQTMSKSCVS